MEITKKYTKQICFFIRKYSAGICLSILLIINLLLRIDSFSQPNYYWYFDWNRDFLVAHHIVHYGELPLKPPPSGGIEIGQILGSPMYHYFLAVQLLIKDDILFVGWINLLFQILNLFFLYLLAKGMFGRTTALIGVTIFGFSEGVLNQSNAVWQPHAMQPFITISYLLLLLAYSKRKYYFLLGSIVMFLTASVMHVSAIALGPIYICLVLIVVRKIGNIKWHYIGVFMTFLLTFMLLHLPSFYIKSNVGFPLSLFSLAPKKGLFDSFGDLVNNFILRVETLLNFLFIRPNQNQAVDLLGIIFFSGFAFYLVIISNHFLKKWFFLILSLSIIQFLLISVFVKAGYPTDPFPSYYLTPILGIFTILIAETINKLLPNKKFLLIKIFIVLFVLNSFSPQLPYRLSSIVNRLSHESLKSFLIISYHRHPGSKAIEDAVVSIKNNEKREELDFFQLQGYLVNTNGRIFNDAMDIDNFLNDLEKSLRTKLTKVDDSNFRFYTQTGSDNYIFLVCPNRYNTYNRCLDAFLSEHPNHKLEKNIYTDEYYKIYTTKHE